MREGTRSPKDPATGLAVIPWRVVAVRGLTNHRLFVRFVDGTEGEVDTSEMVFGPNAGVFERLRDPAVFAEVRVEEGVVAWPGGLDIAPDAMYDEIMANGRWTIRRKPSEQRA